MARKTHRLLQLGFVLAAINAFAESADKATVPEMAPDSPRASVTGFLTASNKGHWEAAAEFLDAEGRTTEEASALARKLKAVIDRHIWLDVDKLSPASTGALNDGLPANVEELGKIPVDGRGTQTVRLKRLREEANPRWVFTASTVERIDVWYEALGDRWVVEHLPQVLLRSGPRGILWWQWLFLLVLIPVSGLMGRLLSWATRWVAAKLAARTEATWDDSLARRLVGPLALLWSAAVFYLLLPWVALYASTNAFAHSMLKAVVFVAVTWAVLRTMDVVAQTLMTNPAVAQNPATRSLLPVGLRTAKFAFGIMALIAILSFLGLPVASLLTGLGIGGLALALAGQKTVENLFGAFSIAVDQPFREGDFVRIEDFVGTVEAIGLRSTRIRTLDRTVISIPNGKLAEMRLETFALRDRIRMHAMLGLTYETTVEQMRSVLVDLEQTIRAHPAVWPEAVVVRFSEFAASSLNVEIMLWIETNDFDIFRKHREELFLSFMSVVGRNGCSFAFPTQTIHIRQKPQS